MSTKPILPAAHQPEGPRPRSIDRDKAQLHRQVRLLTAEVIGLEEQLQALRQSTSWRVSAPLRWMSRQLQGKAARNRPPPKAQRHYAEWVRLYDTAAPGGQGLQAADASGTPPRASFAIVLAPRPDQMQAAAASIDAIRAQGHPDWELLIVVEPAALADAEGLRAEAGPVRDRVQLCECAAGGSKAAAFNCALERVRSDWTLWLEPGDVLPPWALGHFAAEAAGREEVGILYCDHDHLDESGQRCAPRFKPDWNPDLFHAQDYIAGAVAWSTSLLRDVGGMRDGFADATSYDLLLRCVERLRTAQVLRVPRVLWHKAGANVPARLDDEASAHEARALAQHLDRSGITAQVAPGDGVRRLRYALPAEPPLVTLIIPTRNGLSLLRQCVESIVALTTYPNYELLLVDNGSDEPQALAYLAALDGQPGITVIRDDRPFNYSALNNMAARRARGTVLGLINNDIELISPDWLEEMVSLALQPGVGAVGAKLLYPDGTVQHGGVLLGVGGATGIAGHANKDLPAGEPGYMRRSVSTQSFSAVTAACLIVRKALYEQVDGLDEVDLTIAYNDVDFCLKLREAGYRNVWTPYAELFHHESATRGSDFSPAKRERFDREQEHMRSKWGPLIADDPAYNPNLTVYAEDFGLAWPPRVPWISGAAQP
ncbi:glycosyltransferase family 2 protein [Variovorax sp. J22P168]|uniref:glycosyltransferase family 2 protein n=1 Tax=Variovorax jilinensis TaxID=3053513 RepID=UPI002577E0E4|nr:glycosyltransferase family 2 protein [Variovorax sp. J22P168]MDM0011095.1 glycosyltransferase family 2 protein [Variovorax sp. J22P168]